MLPNFSPYASQGLAPQIPGLQGIGAPQLNSALGQAGVFGNTWSGPELGQPQAPNWGGQVNPFGHNPLQTLSVLAQLAQQLAIQCAITQQVAQQMWIAVQQVANQLAAHGLQGQFYGQNPYAAALQGAYPGFNPAVQAWGPNRQPTIQ